MDWIGRDCGLFIVFCGGLSAEDIFHFAVWGHNFPQANFSTWRFLSHYDPKSAIPTTGKQHRIGVNIKSSRQQEKSHCRKPIQHHQNGIVKCTLDPHLPHQGKMHEARSKLQEPYLHELSTRRFASDSFTPQYNSHSFNCSPMEKVPLLSGSESCERRQETYLARLHSRVRLFGGLWLIGCFLFLAFLFREELKISQLLNEEAVRTKPFGWDDVS